MENNNLLVADAIGLYRSPADQDDVITIIRPFAVFSGNAYSTPVVLPIGPAYLAALLEHADYKVDLIDGIIENLHNIENASSPGLKRQGMSPQQIVERINPRSKIIAISCMFTQEWSEHRELIKLIRKSHSEAKIIVGGEHVTALWEYTLKDCPEIDYLVTGEGELSFLKLVHGVVTDTVDPLMPGLCHRDIDGTFHNGGLGLRIADFDNLPRPAWHLIPVENYFVGMFTQGISMGRNMPVIASRGCPYQCTFCSNPQMWTTRYLLRDVKTVIDEIEFLVETYNVNSIDFADLTAIVKKEWIIDFCAELKRRELDIIWQLPSGTRSEALDREALQAMFNAGCRYLVYAPESASEDTLKHIKKKLKIDKLISSVSTAVEIGHTVKVNLIVGFPGEKRPSMQQTLGFCIKMALAGVADCNVAIFSPYPGSELYQELRDDGTLGEPDDEYIKSLISLYDFTATASFCKTVPPWEVKLYRFLGMALFYLVSYVRRPSKLFGFIKMLRSESFQASNLFEQRIYDFVGRKNGSKQLAN